MSNLVQMLVDKHKINCTSLQVFLKEVQQIANRHDALVNGVTSALEAALIHPANGFVSCPTCSSHTVLSLENCHLCGSKLFEDVNEEKETTPSLPLPVKEKAKEKKVAKEIEPSFEDETKKVVEKKKAEKVKDKKVENIKETKVEDDDLSFLDEEPEEVVKVEKNPITKTKEDKKTKASKPVKESKVVDEDDDLSFLDDEDEPVEKTKSKTPTNEDDDLLDDDDIMEDVTSPFSESDFDDIDLD
jgi:hypothetical protein